MVKSCFLDVPEDICEKILKKDFKDFNYCFRGIRHNGQLVPTDFYPTFVDPNIHGANEKIMEKGPLGKIIAKDENIKKRCLGDYSLSLFTDLKTLNNKLRRDDHRRNKYPMVALGKTSTKKERRF